MGVPPAKLHEKPAEANKSGTDGEQKAGFFDPVNFRLARHDRPQKRWSFPPALFPLRLEIRQHRFLHRLRGLQ
jgi:hypothetical protein